MLFLVGHFFYSRRVIDKERPNFLVGTGKGQVEYSKLLFTTFHSRITIPVSSASNSFPTEQNSSVAKLYSSPVAPETLISLMSYDVCENTHTHTRPRRVSRTERFPALDIYTSIYIYTRDARVSQSTRWCIEEARAIKRHVLLRGYSERKLGERRREKRRREINRNSKGWREVKKETPCVNASPFPHWHVSRLVLQGIVIHALRADPELASTLYPSIPEPVPGTFYRI